MVIMRELLLVLLILFLAALFSIAHERDIYNQCVKHGRSGSATWGKEIKCSPM